MGHPRVVVGINRTQDGSICVARGSSDVVSLQKERLTRRKHHWGRLGDLPALYVPHVPALREPIDLVVECYSSDAEAQRVDDYHDELRETLEFRGEPRIERVSHHLAHLYSAFFPSPFDAAAVMVIDAQGSPARELTEAFPGGVAAAGDFEVASFYSCERDVIACVAKQFWDGDWQRPVGLGCFYYLLTRMIFPGEGNEGKVMGLAPFGRPEALDLPHLRVDGHEVHIPAEWLAAFGEGERFRYREGDAHAFAEAAKLAAAGQAAFESALLRVARWLAEETGQADLCFAGGSALNCSGNGRLLRESGFRDLFIPPSPHDGGTALGSALYGLVGLLGERSGFRWTDDFLGPETTGESVEALVADLPVGLFAERPADLAGHIVELLASGRVVGIHQGRSESGPRALGNRSILADARHPGMQDFINAHVKGREWFRPLAPLVLLDAAPDLFEIDRPAPFMQIATDVREQHREALPAITHVDGTARLQTVEATHTPFLHELLTRFADRTGSPVLLNTSLNGKGEPLAESPADSVQCLSSTSMHALVVPPYVIRKHAEPAVPAA